MKKIFLLLIMLIGILFVQNVSALDANINIENGIYVNQNGIKMTEENVNNLKNLGFTDSDIIFMREKEFNENKNLKGHIESSVTKYYEVTTILTNGNYNYINGPQLTFSREMTKEEYDNVDVEKIIEEESTQGLTPGSTVTEYKEMTTTITSVNGRYRYSNHVKWKKLPYWQTVDIIAIGIEDKVYGISNTKNFYAYYENGKVCNYFTDKGTWTLGPTGYGVVFKYPSEHPNHVSTWKMDVNMYFEVDKNTTQKITVLNAYGNYRHGKGFFDVPSISISVSYIIGISGNFESSFDKISTAQATLTGINW